MNQENIVYKYSFTLETGELKEIELCLDSDTLALLSVEAAGVLPIWTRLTYSQCPHCPLDVKQHPHCPIAVNISSLADSFGDFQSHHKSKVCVQNNVRTVFKNTDIQTALSSILGIYMVTSGCPVMDKLRPMVRFHLPFSNALETQYRAICMYLFGQYLRHKQGKKPDWDLTGFEKMYAEIRVVNLAFSQRLSYVGDSDANQNALIILDNCAAMINLNAQANEVIPVELESVFKYLTDLA
jgi:hypothetical protein